MSKDIYKMPAHEYSLAGVIKSVQGVADKNTGKYEGGAFSGMDIGLGNAMGAIGSAVGGMAGSAIGGGKTSPAGDVIGGLGKIAGAIPGPWGAIAGAGLGVISGLTNAAFGSKINQENVNAINNNIGALNSFKSNASSFDDLSQNISSQPTAMRFNQSTVGSDGWFSNKAKNMYKDLVAQQDAAQQFVNNSITNNMNNLINTQYQDLAASYAAQGGPLSTQGADWTTGLNYIGAGGSHESNPNNGVQMGIAPDGLPNLVEEGEVIWNGDYVFSKRLKVNKSDKEDLKLGYKDKQLSFADAALKLNKEVDEMPNDPIAKRSRDAMLGRLADAQEIKRAKIQAKEQQKAMLAQALLGNAPIEQPVEETPETVESEQPIQEEQPQPQTTPEEYMAQQTAQGMPMESMYAAKGGLMGHKFATAGAKPNVSDEVANWWRQFWKLADKDRTYFDWGNDVFNANKDKFTKYGNLTDMINKFSDADKMLETANDGGVGDVSNLINLLYNNRNVKSNSSYFPRQHEWVDLYSTQTYPIPVQSGIHDIDWMMRYSNYLGERIRAKIADEVPNPDNYGEYRGIKYWSSPQDVAKGLVSTPLDWNDLTAYRHGLASIPQRWRDEQGNMVYDKDGSVKIVPGQYEQIKTNPIGRAPLDASSWDFNKETGKLEYKQPTAVERNIFDVPQLSPINTGIQDYMRRSLISSGNGQALIDAYKDTPIVQNIPETTNNEQTTDSYNYPWEGYLRYAPVVGSALSVFSDLAGFTNKPDYSAANALASATSNLRDVSFTPIGDYAAYKPIDIMAPINQINANAGATRRNIINTSGGNRGTAIAGLLAADNTFNNTIGQTYINAENTNYDRYMKALAHNAQINQFNSQGFLQAATANQKMDEVRTRYSALAADARAKALQQANATRSANLTTLFDNLGNLGIDALNRADAKELAQLWAGADRFASTQHKKGGKLNKKVKRRYII